MKQFIRKARILIEALPYIQQFKGKITLIKFGGSTMADESWMNSLLTDIVFLSSVGIRPVVVHGGGTRISEAMKALGKKPKFIQGFRVTDDETIQTVEHVLYNEINTDLVNRIKAIGGDAEGLSGKKHGIIQAKKHRLEPPRHKDDLGFVGDVDRITAQVITSVIHQNKIPVIAPVALGEDGHTYNVNADLAAGEIARAIGAEKLVFLTDVAGILREKEDANTLFSHVDVELVNHLIKKKIIAGGMIPKVMAAMRAVNSDVNKTHIINGLVPHSLLLEIFTDKGIGTEIVKTNTK